MATLTSRTHRIPADHPALPGHFPGHPVVPGVVILEQVAQAATELGLEAPGRFPQVKFIAPLPPEVPFRIEIDDPGRRGGHAFRCLRDDGSDTLLCAGQLAPGPVHRPDPTAPGP
ncbi:hypothetical protein [Thioalkalivibrio sp. ALJ24]|uniref:hypothetical protein n=1 Tax=Thioalkalivibrio sp. ALJ24 TaxID=545276 RepID=UPI000365502A|nr:hypothetical protein [Thioalkalivibrio sp. ALJ24]